MNLKNLSRIYLHQFSVNSVICKVYDIKHACYKDMHLQLYVSCDTSRLIDEI